MYGMGDPTENRAGQRKGEKKEKHHRYRRE